MTLILILRILAFVLFLVGTWNPPYPRSFISAGLAAWVLSTFVDGIFH